MNEIMQGMEEKCSPGEAAKFLLEVIMELRCVLFERVEILIEEIHCNLYKRY